MLRKGEAFDEDRFWSGSPSQGDRPSTGSSSLSRKKKERQHAAD
jgi:hypothetical protein